MHVSQFFNALLFGAHGEVVRTFLLLPITTECDEVNRSFEVVALEPCCHTMRLCGGVIAGR